MNVERHLSALHLTAAYLTNQIFDRISLISLCISKSPVHLDTYEKLLIICIVERKEIEDISLLLPVHLVERPM